MKTYSKFIIVIPAIVAILLSFFIFLKFKEKRNFNSYVNDAKVFSNVPLPESNLTSFENNSNRNYNNDVLQGRVLLIFLSTSCSACKKQVKTITQSFSALATKVKVYGVTVEEKDKAKRYVEENNLLFPLLIDNGGKMFTSLSIKYFPTNVLVENGVITKTWIGSSPSQESLLESLNLGEIH